MGWRFRHSIKIFPGVKLNIGKKSTSVSIGGKGASINFGKHGTRTTIGIPGTGISYTTYEKKKKKQNLTNSTNYNYTAKDWGIALITFLVIFGVGAFILTSCKNSQKERKIQEKITQETCEPISSEFDWCKNAPAISLRGKGMTIEYNFEHFMNLKPLHDYIHHSGIKTIKSKKYPNAKYAIVYIMRKDFRDVPGTEKTFIMDGGYNGISVIDGNLFEN